MKINKKSAENTNWTERSIENFRYFVGADFINQLQNNFESLKLDQRSFAQLLDVNESRVSQVMNNPGNLTLNTMIKWGRAAGLKTGVVLYNDNDVANLKGPLSGSIFVQCWKNAGSPSHFNSENEYKPYATQYNLSPLTDIFKKDTAPGDLGAAVVKCFFAGKRMSTLPEQYDTSLNEEITI